MARLDEITAAVNDVLAASFDATVVGDHRFEVAHGSTKLWIVLQDRGNDDAPVLIKLQVLLLDDVPRTPELFEYVALHADDYIYGHLSVLDDPPDTASVFFTHSLLVQEVDAVALTSAIRLITSTADDLDDELAERFGGERARSEVD